VVPTQYATIASAVAAAPPGSTIRILSGRYAEQLVIDKPLKLIGAGRASTTLQAPAVLAPGASGGTSIVEVVGNVRAGISGLTVAGPGPGPCGSLGVGIHVLGGATLELRDSAVRHIRDEPASMCFPSGAGVVVGLPPFIGGGSVGHAILENVLIDDFQFAGISVDGAASTLRVVGSRIVGAGFADGIDVVFGADATILGNDISNNFNAILIQAGSTARIEGNRIRENRCAAPFPCGSDPFSEFQFSGVTLAGGGSGVTVRLNDFSDNDAAISSFSGTGDALLSFNAFRNNLFGALVWDGSETLAYSAILSGEVGVGVVAAFADSAATLDHVLSGPVTDAPTREYSCCGHSTSVVLLP
jgi:parallel beta-helix repeat protein